MPQVLPSLAGHPEDLPVKQEFTSVCLAPTLGFLNKRGEQGAGKWPGNEWGKARLLHLVTHLDLV